MSSGGGGSASGTIKTVPSLGFIHSMVLYGLPLYGDNRPKAAGLPGGTFDDPDWGERDPRNMYDILMDALDTDSPWADEYAYDPGSLTAAGTLTDSGDELQRVGYAVHQLKQLLYDDASATDPTAGTQKDLGGDWWTDRAADAADSDVVDGAVDAFEDASLDQHLRAVNRVAGQFADINAVQSSMFPWAMAAMESDRLRTIQGRRSELEQQNLRDRIQLLQMEIEGNRVLVEATAKASQMSIIEHYDRSETNRIIQEKDIKWDFEVFRNYGNLIGAFTGSVVPESTDARTNKALSGLVGGAAGWAIGGMATVGTSLGAKAGAEFGSVIAPGIGTIAGGVVGALIGALGS